MSRHYSPRGEARARVLDAALDLFSEHGFSGTSLQMIADHIGVTKAAVYHQFHTKEEMVLALMDPPMARLHQMVESVEAKDGHDLRARAMFADLIDLVLEFRRRISILRTDPAVQHIVNGHPEMQVIIERLGQLLVGDNPTTSQRVAVAVLGNGIMNVGTDPSLFDIDEETLREELVVLTARAIGLPAR